VSVEVVEELQREVSSGFVSGFSSMGIFKTSGSVSIYALLVEVCTDFRGLSRPHQEVVE
jgi:hypothetical protein